MKSFALICAVCVQIVSSYGQGNTNGVGAYSYQDSTGNRYGGTYGLRNGQVVNPRGLFPAYQPNVQLNRFNDVDNFFPAYFRNLQGFLQEAFDRNTENQKLALNAARKAFDYTSDNAFFPDYTDDYPDFSPRFPFNNFLGFPPFPNMAGGAPMQRFNDIPFDNSAFAAAAISPGFQHQVAAISPMNPNNPNVNVIRYSDPTGASNGMQVVSSSSFVSNLNKNGEIESHRESTSYVNDGGKVTAYKVTSH